MSLPEIFAPPQRVECILSANLYCHQRPACAHSSLMITKSSDYRAVVLERQRNEELRRQVLPFGGDRAWQLGLRQGGIFYEPIGSYLNGLFCPYRPPVDSGKNAPKDKAQSEMARNLEKLERNMRHVGSGQSASAPVLREHDEESTDSDEAALEVEADDLVDDKDVAALDDIDDQTCVVRPVP